MNFELWRSDTALHRSPVLTNADGLNTFVDCCAPNTKYLLFAGNDNFDSADAGGSDAGVEFYEIKREFTTTGESQFSLDTQKVAQECTPTITGKDDGTTETPLSKTCYSLSFHPIQMVMF